MRGIPQFNFPEFFRAQRKLERQNKWDVIFNPAEDDVRQYGDKVWMDNAYGDEELAAKDFGLYIRDVLAKDCEFICKEATTIYMLPNWEQSRGATAEHALAEAIGLEIIYGI